MKKLTPIFLLSMAAAIGAGAQRTVVPVKNTLQVKLDKTALIPKATKTATGKLLYLTTTQGKDLTIGISKVDDNSISTMNRYTVHYTLINCGSEDLNISNLVMQGYFYSSTSGVLEGGGTTLLPATLGSQTILHPGEYYEGTMNPQHGFLYSNQSYTYALKCDNGNLIPEANETNNMAEVQVTAHIPSPTPPDPDLKPDLVPSGLEVSYNAQTHLLHINYIVTNIGRGAVDLTKVSAQGMIVRPGAGTTGGCGSVVTSILGTMLLPNKNVGGSYNCSQVILQSGTTYRYDLTISSYYQVPEFNANNNTVSINFTIP